jgi:hypothetical protein
MPDVGKPKRGEGNMAKHLDETIERAAELSAEQLGQVSSGKFKSGDLEDGGNVTARLFKSGDPEDRRQRSDPSSLTSAGYSERR